VQQYRSALVCLWFTLLVACAAPVELSHEAQQEADGEGLGSPNLTEIAEDEITSITPIVNERQFIADLLYEALQALDNDRLLTPVDDNAHGRFKRVLAYEPDNEIALEGLQDIVQRYVELAEQSMRRGLFEEAKTFLDNARFVDASHPDIAGASLALQSEMNSADLFFNLDNREFAGKTEKAMVQLADIAEQARQENAFFLITAPNDEQARWMFGIMRDAVSGYRLRGNIELSSQTTIRLRLPKPKE